MGAFLQQGIIPARAGFTLRRKSTDKPVRDHPRSRGVYRTSVSAVRSRWGSSPLARGLPGLHGDPRQGARIIPARAGFTLPILYPVEREWDHPRSRGVYDIVTAPIPCGQGSSPLARGLRVHGADHRLRHGIIPARAGFTAPVTRQLRPATDHPRSRGVYF